MHIPEIITRKRDGLRLGPGEIRSLVERYTANEVPDYQMSAFLMAVMFRGLDAGETAALTEAMLCSGTVLDLKGIPGPKVDKHSTGGVGDKVSLCLAPLAAAAGIVVPMISGRGLGHTGGTLDKLEAIPGFDVRLPLKKFMRLLERHGLGLIGQTDEIAPADRRLYALRDVTATVESIPLITASILSKKLAEGLDGLVLDVKTGSGAFMPELRQARALARSLVQAATRAGCRTTAIITDMGQPLGRAVGNALEVKEAVDVLRGEGPDDVRELTLVLGAEMLLIGRISRDRRDARSMLERNIESGRAFELFLRVVEAQGGDPCVIEDTSRLPRARMIREMRSLRKGWIRTIDAREVGLAAVKLGAGRSRIEDDIDPGAGFVFHKKVGDPVDNGELLAEVHGSSMDRIRHATERLGTAFGFSRNRREAPALVLEKYGLGLGRKGR